MANPGAILVAAGWALAGLLAAAPRADALQAREPPAGRDRFAGWERMVAPDWRFDPDDRPVLGFSVPSSVEARAADDEAAAALRAGDVEAAGRRLVGILAQRPNHALQVDGGTGRWVGAGEWALYLLDRSVPPEVRARLSPDGLAAKLERATAWRDVEALLELGRAAEGLPEGALATERAARLLAERGDGRAAAVAADRALSVAPDEAAAARLAALRARLPAPSRPADASPPGPVGESLPGSLLPIWNERLTMTRLVDWMALQGYRWMARWGDVIDEAYNSFATDPNPYDAPVAPIVPVVDGGVVYVADGLSVTALDLRSGRRLWHHAGPMEDATQRRLDPPRTFDLGVYARDKRRLAISPYQHAAVAVSDGLVLATVQVTEPARDLRTFDGIPINWPLPRRRLVALDRRDGSVAWEQQRPDEGAESFRNRFDVAGPVAVAGGHAYAVGSVTEGAINAYVTAFDLRTGDMAWRTLLCSGQQDLTMFNRPFQEHVVSPPLLAGDDLYLCTNLGLVACLDAWSGRLRWLTGYEPTERMASRSPHRQATRQVHWTNHPPVLEAGRLFVTPLDGERLLVLDPATGRVLNDALTIHDARLPGSFRHDVTGTGRGLIVVSGPQSVVAYDARTMMPAWERGVVIERRNPVVGPAVAAGGAVFAPLLDELLVLDAESGAETARRSWLVSGMRRVVPAGPALVMTDNLAVYAALDVEQELTRAGSEQPGSVDATLELAELLLGEGRHAEARRRFEEVIASGDARLSGRARSGRLESTRRMAHDQGDRAAWLDLLAVAHESDAVLAVAAEALPSLSRLGAEDEVDRWLGRLAEGHPDEVVALGALTPDGPARLGLVVSLRALPSDPPARAVERLQALLRRDGDARWNGRPLREEAAARIDALIARHGREIYEPFDRAAAEQLSRAEDVSALAGIEERFPNALVVAEARALRLQSWLAEGRAAEVLAELATLPTADRHPGLRADAARAMGDHAWADAIEGAVAGDPPAELPRLPGAGATLQVLYLDKRDRISFPPPRGSADPGFAAHVLVAINGRGHLQLLDTVQAELPWDRRLPGRIAYARSRDLDLLLGGRRLFVRGGRELVALDLAGGHELWGADLAGAPLDVLLAGGLVLTLEQDQDRLRLRGFGEGSGTPLLDLQIPGALDGQLLLADGVAALFARGDAGARLLVIDTAAGRIEAVIELDRLDAVPVMRRTRGAPVAVLAGAARGGLHLAGWDLRARAPAWEHEIELGIAPRVGLVRSRPDGFLVAEPVREGGTRLRPFDFATGPGEPAPAIEGELELLSSASSGLEPRVVLADAADPGRLVIADPVTGRALRTERLDPPPSGALRLLPARDGFALVAEALQPDSDVEVWLVRGDSAPQRYSIDVEMLNVNGRSELTLADGALLVARGGAVALLREDSR